MSAKSFFNLQVQDIIDRIEFNTIPLSNLVEFSKGALLSASAIEDIIPHGEAYLDKELFEDYVPVVNENNIHRYSLRNEIRELVKYAEVLKSPKNKRFVESEKIIVKEMLEVVGLKIIAAYSEKPSFVSKIGFSIIGKSDNISLLKIAAILNSSLMAFYHRVRFIKSEKINNAKIFMSNCKYFPIKYGENDKIFENVVEAIRFVLGLPKDESIIDQVPNKHIIQSFEDVIDALVLELYFKSDFEKVGIQISKNAEKIFISLDNFSKSTKYTSIQDSYKSYREKGNPLRNQIKLMKIEMNDLLLPILSV